MDGKTTTINNYYTTKGNAYENEVYYAPSSWVIIHYLFAPAYVVYTSPWYWSFYPSYWNPWSPWFYHSYYHHWYYYDGFFRRSNTYRISEAQSYYGPRRSVSTTVYQNRTQGMYQKTYSRPDLGPRTINQSRQSSTTDIGRNNRNSFYSQPRNNNVKPRGNYSKPVQAPKPMSRPSNNVNRPRDNNAQPSSRPAPRPGGPHNVAPSGLRPTPRPSGDHGGGDGHKGR